jgi:hypothetical protein
MLKTWWNYGEMAFSCLSAILCYILVCNLSRCEPSFGQVISMEPSCYYPFENLFWMPGFIEYPEYYYVYETNLSMIKAYLICVHRVLAMLHSNFCYHTCSNNEEKLEYSGLEH